MKRLITALAIAMAIFMVPVAGVLADDPVTVFSGTTDVIKSEPIRIDFVSISSGTYENNKWTISVAGGSTAKLELKATNTGTVPYTVVPTITPAATVDGVTASWSSPNGRPISPGGSYNFVLTITVAPNAPLGTTSFNFGFTR